MLTITANSCSLRIPELEVRTSMIREMSIKSAKLGAVNLSQGFPDDDPPPEVLELLTEASAAAGSHQYSDPRGAAVLRSAIADKVADRNKLKADPARNVIVTCGATEALMVTFRSLFTPGDEILVFTPAYENYFHQARVNGLKLVPMELKEPGFGISLEALEDAATGRLRGLLLCNPCNPTGKLFTARELAELAEFACRHNLVIISDETYERFIWRGEHISIGSLPGAEDRTVSIFSMGKTYSVTGWRIGYVVAPDACSGPIAAHHGVTTVSAAHPFQLALAKALRLPESFYIRTLEKYRQRKDQLMDALRTLGVSPWDPAGSYFLWCDYSRLSNQPDIDFANRLLHLAGVAGVPGRVFYPQSNIHPPSRIRFTFSKSPRTIRDAANRLMLSKQLFYAN